LTGESEQSVGLLDIFAMRISRVPSTSNNNIQSQKYTTTSHKHVNIINSPSPPSPARAIIQKEVSVMEK
jgi:hypothetical protein